MSLQCNTNSLVLHAKQSQKMPELIVALLIMLIPFISTNLTYDPTTIKTTLIKTGFIIIFILYLIDSFKKREIAIKKVPPVFFLFLLIGYLTLNFAFKYPASSAEKFFTLLLFFSFFLPLFTSPLRPTKALVRGLRPFLSE